MSFRGSRHSLILLFAVALPAFAGSAAPGINNFYQVDGHVYRGGQPTDEGFRYLARIGVKTVIDLREADGRSSGEERVVRAAGMTYINVPMTGLTPPTESEISRILGILEDDNTGPVFVHCKRGRRSHRRCRRLLPDRPRPLGECSGPEGSHGERHEFLPISTAELHKIFPTPRN